MRTILLSALEALLPDEDADEGVEGTDVDDDPAEIGHAGRKAAAPKPPASPPTPPSAQALARAAKTVKRATDALTDARLLAHRPPRLLRRDITLLATLLRVARREGWVDAPTFAQLSARALSTLFVAGAVKGKPALATGWLEERRVEDAERHFAEDFASVGFVAGLCAWLSDALGASEAGEERRAIEHAGLAAFSTVRWLFERSRAVSFGGELARSVAIAAADPDDAWHAAKHAWRRWDRSGRAVLRLQARLRTKRVAEWRSMVPGRPAARGDLVYTGKGILGVVHQVETDGRRTHVEVAPVTGATVARFDAAFVVHLDDALAQVVGSEAARWLADARASIDRMALPPEPPKAPIW